MWAQSRAVRLDASLRLHGPWNAGEPGASAHTARVPFVDRGEASLQPVTSVGERPCAPRFRTPTVPCGVSSTSSSPERYCRANSLFSPT